MAKPVPYDVEDMIQETVDNLTAHLNTYIGVVNTEKPDAYVIDAPLAIHFGNRKVDPDPTPGKSTIVVYPNLTEGQTFNPGTTEEDSSIDVLVIYWGSKAEEVERKILRYAKAIRLTLDNITLFKDSDPKASNIGDSVVSLIEYMPLDLIGNMYFKSAIVRLKIRDIWCYGS